MSRAHGPRHEREHGMRWSAGHWVTARPGTRGVVVAVVPTSGRLKIQSEAIIALMSLGYTRSNAESAVRAAAARAGAGDVPVELLIKEALQHASKP